MNHILKFLIPTLLGDYVEGLDYNNIKASYFSGEVILENFSLRKKHLQSKRNSSRYCLFSRRKA